MGVWDDTRSYILENKLKSIGERALWRATSSLLGAMHPTQTWKTVSVADACFADRADLKDTRPQVTNDDLNSCCLAAGILWASGLGASLAYQWSRPIPNSLKVIHSRVYAQVRGWNSGSVDRGLVQFHLNSLSHNDQLHEEGVSNDHYVVCLLQALTLGSLAAVAVIEHMDHKSETSQVPQPRPPKHASAASIDHEGPSVSAHPGAGVI